MGFIPTAGIFDAPAVGVCINQEWLPFIIGALEPLALPEMWPETVAILSVEIEDLIARLAKPAVDPCTSSEPLSNLCHLFDFTLSDQNWVPYVDGTGTYAIYTFPNGWTDGYPATTFDGLFMNAPGPLLSSIRLTKVTVVFDSNFTGANPHVIGRSTDFLTTYFDVLVSTPTNTVIAVVTPVDITNFQLVVDANVGGAVDLGINVTSVEFCFQAVSDPYV